MTAATHTNQLFATWRHWRGGIRLYIALGTALITIETAWWADALYGNTHLFALRVEEVYAWLSVGFLVLALTVGPAYRLLPRLAGRALMRDARRLFGVSAGWFAALHVLISYGAILHWDGASGLSGKYRWALVAGILAMLVLAAMVATSFDAAFKRLGRWWFRLHRLVYAAGLLIVLHAVLIGSHAATLRGARWLLAAAAFLLVLHGIVLWRGHGHER